MSDNQLKIECEVTFEDIINWNRHHLENNPLWRRRIRKIRTIGFPLTALLLVAGIFLLVFSVGLLVGILALAIGILGCVALIIFPGFMWKSYEKYLRQRYYYVPHKDVGSHTYEITEDGLRLVTAKGATRLRWIEVKSIVQNPDYIYINIPPYSSVIIPRCAFADDASFNRAADDLKEMLHRYQDAGKA